MNVAQADTDADAYFSAITAAGGTMSLSDQAAITTFVTSAKSNGYWNKLIDVGPLAGDQLAAALVKLKYPTASSTLTNYRFVSSDYTRTTGLTGSSTLTSATSVKYLDTGIIPQVSFAQSGTMGMAYWKGADCVGSFNMGTANGATPYILLSDNAVYAGGTTSNINIGAGEGFVHGIRQSSTLLRFINNGKIIGTNTTATAPSELSKQESIGVFAQIFRFNPFAQSPTGCSGYYYSIDDGTMSNTEATQYYNDVRQLQIGLGRLRASSVPKKMSFIIGQSLGTGSNGTPVLSTTASTNNTNAMFSDGMLNGNSASAMRSGLRKLTEAVSQTVAYSFAGSVSNTARAITPGNSSQDLVIGNFAVGGWGYDLLKLGAGGATGPFAISTSTVQALVNLSSHYTSGGVVVPGLIVVHGETDQRSVNYQRDIRQWQLDYDSEIKRITGQSENVILFHTQPSAWTSSGNGSTATGSSPYQILAESIVNPTKTVLVGAKYIFPYSDGVHSTNIGYRWMGEYYAKAWNKVIVQGQTWNPLRPTSYVLNGRNIDIAFAGNVGNLVFDTTLVTDPGNYGFEYYDDTNSTTISSVSLTGSNTVRVTLTDTPTGPNKRIRYAFTGVAGNSGGPTTGPRGNLRDSDPTVGDFSGLPLYNWAVHFDYPLPLNIASTTVTTSSTSASIVVNSGMTASSTRVFFGPSVTFGTSTGIVANSLINTFGLSNLKPCTTYHFMASSTSPITTRSASYDLSGFGTSTSVTGTSTSQNFTTTGCTGDASVVASSTGTITTGSGGSLSLGALSLTVPTSYTSTTTQAHFQVKKLESTSFRNFAGVPSGMSQVGTDVFNMQALIDATTTLSTFNQPLTVQMSYSPSDVVGILESSLVIYRFDDGVWTALNNCSVDTVAKTVSCQTSHFSDFGIYATSDTTPPSISAVASSTTSTSATITWTTNESASSTVQFGLTTGYGTQATSTATSTHSVSLTGLTASTLYNFRVTAIDTAGNVATTTNYTFTTSATPSEPSAPTSNSSSNSGGGGGSISSGSSLSQADLAKIFGPKPAPVVPVIPAQPEGPGIIPPTTFSRNLSLGMTGDDVKALQQWLNATGFIVSSTGPGSPGLETKRFGPATRRALAKFQKANGIAPAIGYFGPVTQAFILR